MLAVLAKTPFQLLKVNIRAPKQTPTGHKPAILHMCSALKYSKRLTHPARSQVDWFFPQLPNTNNY